MANKKKLLVKTLAALDSEHPHHGAEIPDSAITEKADGHFRVETIHPATEENKAIHGETLPDDRHISEYRVMTDAEASDAGMRPVDAKGRPLSKNDYGALKSPDSAYKVYRIV